MKSVLITDDCHPLFNDGLTHLGYECTFLPDITPAETQRMISDYEGLIINSKILVDRAMLDAAPQLRFVGRLGSGMEIVAHQAYAAQRGVAVLSSPEGNRNAVAEQALGMLLALANHSLRADREVRAQVWRREANRGFELQGKTWYHRFWKHGPPTGWQTRQPGDVGCWLTTSTKRRVMQPELCPGWKKRTRRASGRRQISSPAPALTDETRHLVDRDFIGQCRAGVVYQYRPRQVYPHGGFGRGAGSGPGRRSLPGCV